MKKIITTFIMMLCAVCVASGANYLTFTAEEDGSTFGIMNNKNTPDVQYSLDDGATWTALTEGDSVILAHKGDKALLKGNNPQGFSNRGNYSFFTMTGKVSASGSVMSLIDGTGLSTEIPNGYCFYSLFMFCTSLTRAPELPATTLTAFCYNSMFLGCTSLTQVPALPATTLANGCYDGMFARCTSLTQAPALPATTLADSCYMYMFSGCTSLSEIHVSFDDWRNADYSTAYWVKNVAPSGTFICPENLPLEYGYGGEDRIPEGWRVKKVIDGDTVDVLPVNRDLLTFTAEEDGSTFGIVNMNNNNPDVQYSLNDGATWTALTEGDSVILAHKGDKALLKGDNPKGFSNRENYSSFTMTGKVAASGSVMSLIDGVELSTEIPNGYCFYRLFRNCTSLTQAPELPATTLAEACYSQMFASCTSLTQAPELPATTLPTASNVESGCYGYMFEGCTSLTRAPELPATTLVDNCYRDMFMGCTSLSEINVSFTSWSNSGTAEWVIDVAPTGTFICPKALALEYGEDRIPEGWTVKYTNYLTFTAEEDSSTFGIVYDWAGILPSNGWPDIQYSLDGGVTWSKLAIGDKIILAKKGDKALIRGYNENGMGHWSTWYVYEHNYVTERNYQYNYTQFVMTGAIAASGSVMSLIDGIGETLVVPSDKCFFSLFSGCTSLTKAPELPATSLASYCYSGMFSGCTSLTNAPELPATTLEGYCYEEMFSGCTSLTNAPNLPVTTLASHCYSGMFKSCTSLTQAPELPATTLAGACYKSMFSGCTSLTNAPELPATKLSNSCYSGMFSGCTSLTNAPNLPATSLEWNCYSGMFSGCTSLTNAPELPATTLEGYCYEKMFSGCTSLTNAPNLPVTTLASHCYSGMFSGCTNLTKAPELPATSLASYCYSGMFSGCTSLTNAPNLPATTLEEYCYEKMFSGCTNLTKAPELPATSLASYCYSGMFSGCTSLTNAPNLPATTLEWNCYEEMFSGCTSLTNAPNLPATTLEWNCYEEMFSGCTNLTKAPELPATSLASNCYSGMFSGCTSLTNAPNLPATTLEEYCYEKMFSGCTNLTKAPNLPASKLTGSCYGGMFSGCTNLSEISVDFTKWGSGHTDFWVENVAPTGTFYCPKELPLEYGVDRIPEGWTVKHIEVGVNATLADNITVWSDDLTIYVRGAKGEVSIYDLSGKRVSVSNSTDEERALSVPAKGVYVVRTNNGTSDVLVR